MSENDQVARIARPLDVPQATTPEDSSRRWIGTADLRHIHAALGTDEVHVNVVYIDAGARSRPHLHTHDQMLFYVSGTGVVAIDGGPDQTVEEGAFALLPGGLV